MKLYIVRHGETLENANNCLVGRLNSSLTENGKKQAYQDYLYFQDKDIHVILSSPLDRCKQTAEIISGGNYPIIYTDKLLGRDHGEFTGVPKESIDFDEYWNYYLNKQYKSAESVVDLYNRVASVIEEIKEKYNDKNVIIVTHSGVIRVLYYYFKGIPENGILSEVEIKNGSVFEYEIGEEK